MFNGRTAGRALTFGPVWPASGNQRLLALMEAGTAELRSAKLLYSRAREQVRCPLHHGLDSPRAPWWFYPQVTNSGASHCRYLGPKRTEAEEVAREALASAVRAFNLLEDFPEADDAHRLVHELGMFVSRHFGCEIAFEDGFWRWSCPVVIAHLRLGQSVGFTAKRLCSICREGILSQQCPHMPNETYRVTVENADYCPCGIEHCAEHQPGAVIDVAPTAIIDEADLEEISWVRRPRDPLARIHSISYTTQQILGLMGAPEIPSNANALECFHCRQHCTGLWGHETLSKLLNVQ
jgi:hypothetical protein